MKLLEKYLTCTPTDERSNAAIAFLASIDYLQEQSPVIAQKILQELEDQRNTLKMIASENYSSLAVQLAMGNLLTDKYAEGYPYHRFYAGCENVDAIEAKAVDTAQALFGADHAYVQPHSGADANLVAVWSIILKQVQSKEVEALHKKTLDELTPEEYERVRQKLVSQKMLGMSLNSGGHLTHGYRHNISSKMMQACFYDVDPKTEQLNYDVIAEKARQEKPLILLAGYSAHPRKINFAKMKQIASEVGATLMVDMAHFAGLVAGKVFTGDYNPIPFADMITSTTHKTLRGPRGGLVLCSAQYKEYVDRGCPMVLGGPLPHVIAAKCIAFEEAQTKAFAKYAHDVVSNAIALAEGLQSEGIRIVTGGTENHMVIMDVSSFGITGRQAETALKEVGITTSRNAIPFDKNGPWYTSGIRLGTAALSSRNMKKEEMKTSAQIIAKVLRHTKAAPNSKAHILKDARVFDELREQVQALVSHFPLYRELTHVTIS